MAKTQANKPLYKDKEWLKKQYYELDQTISQIATLVEKDYRTIYYWLEKFGLPRKSKAITHGGEKHHFFGCKLPKSIREKISKNHACVKGENNPFWGRTHTKQTKNKISQAKKGVPVHSSENRQIRSKRWKKDKNPNWKGGTSELPSKIRNLPEYIQWRKNVFARDGWTCQKCKKVGGFLHADHIRQFAVILLQEKITNIQEAIDCEQLWNIDNGRTLCINCHRKTQTYGKTAR